MTAPAESSPPPHHHHHHDEHMWPHGPVRPVPPPGSIFALGWLMAELFDDRRRKILDVRQPPFSQAVQLPLVADLDEPDLLKFLVADLHDLLRPYPDVSDARVQAEAARRQLGSQEPFDKAAFDVEVRALHLAILDRLADDQPHLNAYQLGLALSDMCWLPAPGGLDAFVAMFRRAQVAAMQTWIGGSATAIPPLTGAIVGQSLGHWADWVDVNVPKLRAAGAAIPEMTTIVSALRVQGAVWHSVLTGDPDVSLNPPMSAWVQAGSAMARAARTLCLTILRRFWPVLVIAVAALVGLLYLVIANLSGVAQVWASLVTVFIVVGGTGGGLAGGATRSVGGFSYDIWSAARREAQAWSVTWLPALRQGAMARARLANRGVAAPQIRTNIEG